MNTVGSKRGTQIKYKANGAVKMYKARKVAKSYSQQEGLDYHNTFSPIAKTVTVTHALVGEPPIYILDRSLKARETVTALLNFYFVRHNNSGGIKLANTGLIDN